MNFLKNKLLLGVLAITALSVVGLTQYNIAHSANNAVASSSTALSEKIAIVDVQLIFEKSTAVQKVRDQIEKKAEEFRKDSTDKEAYFKKKYEELEKQKSVLAKDVYEKKTQDLTKEFSDAQKKFQDNRNVLDKAYAEAMQQFENVLSDIVKDEATKIGSALVLPKMQVLYNKQDSEITDNVLTALNSKLPNIDVKF